MDQITIDKLERLAKLRELGVLQPDEYEAAKRRLIPPAAEVTAGDVAHSPAPSPAIEASRPTELSLSKAWQDRFQFFDDNGRPGTKAYNAAVKKLSVWERRRMTMSLPALILGPVYFLYLKMWKPAISLMIIAIVIAVGVNMLFDLSDSASRALAAGNGALFSVSAIPLYYEYARFGVHRWNPFFYVSRAWGKQA